MDDISDEPALCGVAQSRAEASSNGVCGEPALVDAAAADAERSRHLAWLAEQWARTSAKTRFGVFFLLCAFSGLAAIPCAVLKESFGYGALLIVVAAPLVLLVLVLLLFLMLAEHEVIARLIIVGVQTEGILIGLDSLAILLMRLTDDANVMEGLRFSQGVGFKTCSILELLYSGRVFLLGHQGIA